MLSHVVDVGTHGTVCILYAVDALLIITIYLHIKRINRHSMLDACAYKDIFTAYNRNKGSNFPLWLLSKNS